MTGGGSVTPSRLGSGYGACAPVPPRSVVSCPPTPGQAAAPISSSSSRNRLPAPNPILSISTINPVTAARGTDPKVVVVDDHELFRRGLIGLLEERGIEI